MRSSIRLLLVILSFLQFSLPVWGQKATIKEEMREFITYPFSDPNPVPILTSNTKIYPYHKFEGYSHESESKQWKVVTLENDYIQVFVLPQVGGKVWGAIDKTNGQEFIYRNEVMKFRNISMRGPWTSGGIEFNFGIIGHHPSTATAVDYIIRENDDGSVSCIVGNIDLPSRTHWRVDITLPPDKAYFETKVLWYNPTSQTQSYYNLTTSAAFATEDLQFYTPGDTYLKHSGEAKPWPYDPQGHNLANYAENNFGPSKSYHVVGEYNDFFGGYFHDSAYGFGHWALYEEMPGQKLWLWALSRSGGIWEDLLTDTDGQYIEFQAGRLFDQYSPGAHKNPITQAPFPSHAYDTWRELWFPIKEIGGITDVSPEGVMHVQTTAQGLTIGINALSQAQGMLRVLAEEEEIFNQAVQLKPAEVKSFQVKMDTKVPFEVRIEGMDLRYQSQGGAGKLHRPFSYPQDYPEGTAAVLFQRGQEAMEYREYQKAAEAFKACLQKDAAHLDARIALADLYFRSANFESALKEINYALSIDTYSASANYVAGNIYRALRDWTNALESFGWAARSLQYRSAAYTQMAQVSLNISRPQEALIFSDKALQFNTLNISALKTKYLSKKGLANQSSDVQLLEQILEIDALDHFAYWEKSRSLTGLISNEFPHQSYLELALEYYSMGQKGTTQEILGLAGDVVSKTWLAYLDQDINLLEAVSEEPIAFVFPFRRESLEVMQWAAANHGHWKYKYYLGLNYWGKQRIQEAAEAFAACGQEPEDALFYLTRAQFTQRVNDQSPEEDLLQALKLDPAHWRTYSALITFYGQQQRYKEQLKVASKAYKKWPENYNLGLAYAQTMLKNEDFSGTIDQLAKLKILPFEGASASRRIYETAHLKQSMKLMDQGRYQQALELLTLAEAWPEHLGVGKPFNPDHRKISYLKSVCESAIGRAEAAQRSSQQVIEYTLKNQSPRFNNILGVSLMKVAGLHQQADQIVQDLVSEHPENLGSRALLAFHENNGAALAELEQEMMGKPVYEEYLMVKSILDTKTP